MLNLSLRTYDEQTVTDENSTTRYVRTYRNSLPAWNIRDLRNPGFVFESGLSEEHLGRTIGMHCSMSLLTILHWVPFQHHLQTPSPPLFPAHFFIPLFRAPICAASQHASRAWWGWHGHKVTWHSRCWTFLVLCLFLLCEDSVFHFLLELSGQ